MRRAATGVTPAPVSSTAMTTCCESGLDRHRDGTVGGCVPERVREFSFYSRIAGRYSSGARARVRTPPAECDDPSGSARPQAAATLGSNRSRRALGGRRVRSVPKARTTKAENAASLGDGMKMLGEVKASSLSRAARPFRFSAARALGDLSSSSEQTVEPRRSLRASSRASAGCARMPTSGRTAGLSPS